MSSTPLPALERESIRFFLPGPSYVLDEVRQALTAPVLGHRSAEFKRVYAAVTEGLATLFATAGDVYLATGSSTLVMESAVLSTVASSVLNLTNGSFSERWHAVSKMVGKDADRVAVPWGEAVDPDLVRAALRRKRYDAVTLIHNETSTGVLNPLPELARAVQEESDALLLVDTVSSLGGVPVATDELGLDVVIAGVQKAIAAPPGLVAFTLSDRAAERAQAVPHRGFYTDLLRYRANHREGGSTITTPAVNLFFALERQLEVLLSEGLPARFERHRALRRATELWAAGRGLAYASRSGPPSPTVSCLLAPPGRPAPELVRRLAGDGFTLGGGYGEWKETTFRIGHMGEVQPADLAVLFSALDSALDS
ncbi:MAG TPA: alanine--glyoxylate aminotransferase family protein [Thermoanaerobaculia bacterium]|nr:alanine--glyoxylate aminotransferase family protein [Thermoanaerobaculia bacterium]